MDPGQGFRRSSYPPEHHGEDGSTVQEQSSRQCRLHRSQCDHVVKAALPYRQPSIQRYYTDTGEKIKPSALKDILRRALGCTK